MQVAKNWANRPHLGPGSDRAVKEHKGIAMGMTAPKSPRTIKVDLGGSTTGKVKLAWK